MATSGSFFNEEGVDSDGEDLVSYDGDDNGVGLGVDPAVRRFLLTNRFGEYTDKLYLDYNIVSMKDLAVGAAHDVCLPVPHHKPLPCNALSALSPRSRLPTRSSATRRTRRKYLLAWEWRSCKRAL